MPKKKKKQNKKKKPKSKEKGAAFSIDSNFLCRLQLFIGTTEARISFRPLLRHVTITLSPLQVMSLASSGANLV